MAANALQNLVKEMEQRYSIMSLSRTRSLPERCAREKRGEPPLPYALCVIDGSPTTVAPADVEDSTTPAWRRRRVRSGFHGASVRARGQSGSVVT